MASPGNPLHTVGHPQGPARVWCVGVEGVSSTAHRGAAFAASSGPLHAAQLCCARLLPGAQPTQAWFAHCAAADMLPAHRYTVEVKPLCCD